MVKQHSTLRTVLGLATLCLLASCGKNKETSTIEEKQVNKAPSFKLQDETGAWRTLEEFAGKRVALYFYPKDETPGCTKQACSFRDSAGEYANKNIVVLGINYDSPETHAKFKEHHHLTFPLLSDKDGSVAKAYKADGGPLGRFIPQRVTILIDEQGTIVKRLERIDVGNHAAEVLEAFAAARSNQQDSTEKQLHPK